MLKVFFVYLILTLFNVYSDQLNTSQIMQQVNGAIVRSDDEKALAITLELNYTIHLQDTSYLKYVAKSTLFVKRQKRSNEVLNINLRSVDKNIDSTSQLIQKFKQVWPVERWKLNGWFSDDYLLMINSHWMKYPPPAVEVNILLGGMYIVFMIVGCTGNAIVIVMYLRCRSLRTTGNILVANLALSDFLMIAKTPVFIFNSFNLGPALGKIGCIFYGFMGGLTGITSIATLAAIALDRYWAVVRPLEPLRAFTGIRARCLAIGAWIYAAIFASIPALDIGYGRYVPEGYLTSCSFDYLTNEKGPKVFIFVFFCAAWVAPFCIISFCYLNILRVVVCNTNMTIRNQEQRLSSRHIKEQAKRKAELKLAVLVIVVIAFFFLSWTPYAIVALTGIFGNKDLITPTLSMIPALFCKTAACVNPFIYIITHPNFRKEIRKVINRNRNKQNVGPIKTIGYAENSKGHRHSRDLSITDVEVIEIQDIPFDNKYTTDGKDKVETIATKLIEREESVRSNSMKSLGDETVPPPSWFVKPKFSATRSFKK